MSAPAPVVASPVTSSAQPAAAVIEPTDVKAVVEPAVPAPKPTIAKPDTILANIKARIADANKGSPVTAQMSATDPAKVSADPTKPGEILPDAKATLAELAKAQAKVREYTEKVKALEAANADAEFGKSIKSAKTPLEQLQAVAKQAGKDPTDFLADLVASFQFDSAQDPSKPAQAQPTGELKMVLDKLEAVSKKLADIEAGKVQETEQSAKARQVSEETATKAYIKSVAEKYKDAFEISSRPENIDEAIGKALAKAPEVLARLGFDPANLSEEQAEELAKEAIKEAEQEFEQLGKRFGKVTVPSRPRAYDLPLSKPEVKLGKKPELKGTTGKNWDDYKAEMRARYEASASQHFDTGRTYQSAQDPNQAGIVR